MACAAEKSAFSSIRRARVAEKIRVPDQITLPENGKAGVSTVGCGACGQMCRNVAAYQR